MLQNTKQIIGYILFDSPSPLYSWIIWFPVLITEQNKMISIFSISCILMFLLPPWLACYQVEVSFFFLSVFKIFIWQILILSCFQAIYLQIHSTSPYSQTNCGKQMLFGFPKTFKFISELMLMGQSCFLMSTSLSCLTKNVLKVRLIKLLWNL